MGENIIDYYKKVNRVKKKNKFENLVFIIPKSGIVVVVGSIV